MTRSAGVTILLSLTVFLQLVAETMPPTSDAVPLIGTSLSVQLSSNFICSICRGGQQIHHLIETSKV